VELGGLIVQAYPVHREELPTRWIPRAAAAALRGRLTPRVLAQALRLTLAFPFAETHGLHVTHAATGASFFFLGGPTRQVYDLPERPLSVDAVFLPLVEISDWWLDDATGLVSLLRPRVVVVHHHDDWYPPLTRPADVDAFRRAVEERCGIPVYEPAFARPFTLADLLAEARRTSGRPSEPPAGRTSPA
jgi:L-ascorbate metabolism protein UlaG (beta-lactamase superfamily)